MDGLLLQEKRVLLSFANILGNLNAISFIFGTQNINKRVFLLIR